MLEEIPFDTRKQATLCLQHLINHKEFFHLKDDLMGMGESINCSHVSWILSLLSSSLIYHFTRDLTFEVGNAHLSHLFQL